MVKRFPHTLVVTVSANSTQDEEGHWTEGAPSTKQFVCRWEANSGGQVIKASDGSQIVFEGTVYLKALDKVIVTGAQVEIKNGSLLIAKGSVKNCAPGQLNARLWL